MNIYKFRTIEAIYPVQRHMMYITTVIDYIYNILKDKGLIENQLINIWCKGTSGDVMAALLINKIYQDSDSSCQEILMCKVYKEHENHHLVNEIVYYPDGINIVIDDLVDTGKTILDIIKEIEKRELQLDVLCLGDAYSIRLPFHSDDPINDSTTNEQLNEKYKHFGFENLVIGIIL